MLLTVTMGTKKQFKMYLSDDLFDRLKNAAEKLGKNSGQEVAEEILSIYFPVWLNVNDSMNRAIQYQTNVVTEELVSKNRKESLNQTEKSKVRKVAAEKITKISGKISKEDKGSKVA